MNKFKPNYSVKGYKRFLKRLVAQKYSFCFFKKENKLSLLTVIFQGETWYREEGNWARSAVILGRSAQGVKIAFYSY